MNKQQLAARIWESANQMRSKIEANEYKDYILGFIFYKYLSERELQFLRKKDFSEKDIAALSEADAEASNYIKENNGYFIPYEHLFSTWLAKGKDFGEGNVTDALSSFNRHINPAHKKVFEGIFKTLETGLSKLGESTAARTKAISELIYLIKDIPMDGKQDYDVLGFIYEYLISMFAANAGKKAGEFYTPHEVSLLMSEIIADHLKNHKEIQIYDPTSGSGSLLINIGRSVARHMDDDNNIKYFAQELKQNTYNLTRMNLVMRGILVDNIVTRNGDTLDEDWPYFDENDPVGTYDPLYVDAVVSNPPYSQKWDSASKEGDPRYARFGLAPKTKADYAFLLHDLYHIKPDGIMAIVLPHGVLFRGGEEGSIRKNLIENNHIDAIIGLPANIFFGTGIPTIIMVLKQKRTSTDILIVDASRGFVKVGKNNQLRASDIKRIADTVISRQAIPEYAKLVSREEIRQNDYNLNIPRYVDTSGTAERWDIHATMFGGIPQQEIEAYAAYWQAFPGLRASLFGTEAKPFATLQVTAIKQAISQHPAVLAFFESFAAAFKSFGPWLKKKLISGLDEVRINRDEALLGEEIFRRLRNIALIDKYEAYQVLDDVWNRIAVDVEIIQTEGFEATKKVDPDMVTKKKDGKEQEVQEGWLGHVLPFALVEAQYLENESRALQHIQDRLAEITAGYEELLDSLSEEEKESETVNEAGDSFVAAAVTKEVKQIRADMKKGETFAEDAFESKLLKLADLLAEEKALKAEQKTAAARLHQKTKETIEHLSDEEVSALLEQKWIVPLVTALQRLPETLVATLADKVQALADKYATTYEAVVTEIGQTERSLAAMLDDLTGNAHDMKGISEFTSLLKGD